PSLFRRCCPWRRRSRFCSTRCAWRSGASRRPSPCWAARRARPLGWWLSKPSRPASTRQRCPGPPPAAAWSRTGRRTNEISPAGVESRGPNETGPEQGLRRTAGAASVCVRANTLYYPGGGGHLWVYLNWALGLRALGCRVIWLEGYGWQRDSQETCRLIDSLRERLRPYGLAESLALFRWDGDAAPDAV